MAIVKALQNLLMITCISCLPINRQNSGAEGSRWSERAHVDEGVTETAIRTNDVSWCWLNSFIVQKGLRGCDLTPPPCVSSFCGRQHERTCDGGVTGEGVRAEQRPVGSRRVKYFDKLAGVIYELSAPPAQPLPANDSLYSYYASRTEVCALTLRIPPSNVSSITTRFDGSLQDVSWFQQ